MKMVLKDVVNIFTRKRSKSLKQERKCQWHDLLRSDSRDPEDDVWSRIIQRGSNKTCLPRTICPINSTIEGTTSGKLLKCIQQGNCNGLSSILEKMSAESLDSIRFVGRNLLHFLCYRKDLEALKLVLEKGANANLMDIDGVSPLHVAVNEQWCEGVSELLAYGACPHILPKPPCQTLGYEIEESLLTVARIGDYELCSLFLDLDPDLTLKDKSGNSLLHLAAFSKCLPLLKRLLDNTELDVTMVNKEQNSPLHSLMLGDNLEDAENDIMECSKLLISNGAHLNAVNNKGKTPLYLAARGGLESIVFALLQAGADPAVVAENGRTALHAACRAGSPNVLNILLETGRTSKFVLYEDKQQKVPFHIAVLSSSIDCCLILLDNGDHLSKSDSLGRTRIELVLNNMPSAHHLLRRVFDSYIYVSKTEIDDPEFSVKMNFSPLLTSQFQNIQESIMSEFGGNEAEPLLRHPLVESFLYLKWHSIKSLFYIHVFIYFLFLLLHSYFIAKSYILNTTWDGEEGLFYAVQIFHLLLIFMLVVPNCIYIMVNIVEYMSQFETYFKFTALFTAAFVTLIYKSTSFTEPVKRNLAAISIYFAWVEFMMLLGRFPAFGVYILMFTRVAKAFIKFLMAFSSLIVAFAFAFGILFSGSELFPSLGVSFVKTLMMMVGEVEYADIIGLRESTNNSEIVTDRNPHAGNKVISHLFLVIFVFLVPILMTNLLISLAVNDLGDLRKHGKTRRLVKEASYLVSFERVLLALIRFPCLPGCLIRFYSYKSRIPVIITVYPNQCKSRNKGTAEISPDALTDAIAIGTNSEISGTQNLKHMQNDLESNFNEFYERYHEDRQKTHQLLEKILRLAEMKIGQERMLRSMRSV